MWRRAQIGLGLALALIAGPAPATENTGLFAAFRDICGNPNLGTGALVRLRAAGFRSGSPDQPSMGLAGGEIYSRTDGGVRITLSLREMRRTDGRFWKCAIQVSAADEDSLKQLESWIGVPPETGVGFYPDGSEDIYSFAQRGPDRVPLSQGDDKAIGDAIKAREFRRVFAELDPSMTTIVLLAATH